MKSMVVAALLVTLVPLGRAGEALAGVDVHASIDIGMFHDRLSVYGDWIQRDPYGSVWIPRHVAHDWHPYLMGRWVVTDCGWTWVSDEPWGWATDHYGRWFFDASYGWMWVPDSVWGPAWVAWREGDGYVGWAPLPPGIDVTHGDIDFALDPFAFCFVEQRFFLEPVLFRHVLPPARNVTCVRLTRNFTHYTFAGDRIVNRGIDVREIERASHRSVTRFQLRDVTNIEARRERMRTPTTAPMGHRPGAPAPGPRPRVTAEPAASHTVATPSPETTTRMQERQAGERRTMEAAQARERQQLRSLQARERAHPPANVSRDELRQRHGAEEEAQFEHERVQQHVMDARHERERQASERRAGGRGR